MKSILLSIIIGITLMSSYSLPVYASTDLQIKTDKLNYFNPDKPVVTILGEPNTTVELEITDPWGNIVFSHGIKIPPTGNANYTLDISSYKPGVYSAEASMSTGRTSANFVVGLTTTGSPIQLLIAKPDYVPNETVQIIGFYQPNEIIHLDLVDPNNNIKNSTLLQSDYVGNFQKKFVIPNNALNGTWQIKASSGLVSYTTNINVASQNYNENQINPNNSGPPISMPGITPPLQQFRSGITANHILCKKDMYVILKAENSFPACVSIETGKKLALRGWATTFGTNITMDYWSTCNKPSPKSDSGTAVLYMPTNSIGKICLSYSNYNSEPEPVTLPGISDPNNSYQKPKDITIWTYTPISAISNVNGTTVAYFIKTGNQTGFYGLSLPSCGMIPFAVGYDNDSKIVSSDFPFLGVTVSCPPGMLYPNFDGIEGIGVKYIP